MTTETASSASSLVKLTHSLKRSHNFDNYLMFDVAEHVHLLSLARLKYLNKMISKTLTKYDAMDNEYNWNCYPAKEFYSFTLGAVQRYLKIAENTKEIERLAKIEKYDAAQQLYQETERLKLEAKAYVSKG